MPSNPTPRPTSPHPRDGICAPVQVALLREYGRRLQAGRHPIQMEVAVDQWVDSALYAFSQLGRGTLVQPLQVSKRASPCVCTPGPTFDALLSNELHP
jgi:hypothetical protein